MNIHVISAEDRDRLTAFFSMYRPFLHSEVEQMDILKKKLHDAVIVPESRLAHTIIAMYTTAEIIDLDRRDVQRYTLAYPQQAGAGNGHLSVLSALGAALLGCCEGSVIELNAGTERVRFAVRKVLYQPAWDIPNSHQRVDAVPLL
jgi:regulator of nucleoside diphosphate kinase